MFDLALSINKIAFSIGGLDIAWYGIIVTTGIVFGLLTFLYMCKKQGIDDDFSLSMFLVTVLSSILEVYGSTNLFFFLLKKWKRETKLVKYI